MDMVCVGLLVGGLIGFFVGGFLGFIDTKSDLRDFAEFAGRDDCVDGDESPAESTLESIPDYKEEADRLRDLLKTATDRADRLAAMNEGLTEDLAALKAYDPEEIEERLKKIREIRAEEERKKSLENLERLRREVSAQIALSMLNCGGLNSGGLGFSASVCCSLADQQRISWR